MDEDAEYWRQQWQEFAQQQQLAQVQALAQRQQQAYQQAYQMYLEHGGMLGHGPNWQASSTLCGGALNAADPAHAGFAYSTGGSAIIGTSHTADVSLAVEDAGIRAGEVEGYRAWRIRRQLHSMAVQYEWPPSGIMCGDPDSQWGKGVHAYKTPDLVLMDYAGVFEPLAYGRVALWGVIVEHELGYRAEFARITAIDSVSNRRWGSYKKGTLRRLRRYYGLDGNE